MKICKLQGGLGNQMFQYAAARALEKDANKNIYLDLSFLKEHTVSNETFTARNFELDIFKNLRYQEYTASEKKFFEARAFFRRKYRKMFSLNLVTVTQVNDKFVRIPAAKSIYLDGYFQSEKYFKNIRVDLLSDFTFPDMDDYNTALKERMENENSVSIHIRRGDYISNKAAAEHHGVLTSEYYSKALEVLRSQSENLAYYVFSDDPDYISDNYPFLPECTIIGNNKGKDSWKDMALMQSCKNHIIANSSFSWWGAWLSDQSGITIAPSNWFGAHVSFNIHDFVPDNWIII